MFREGINMSRARKGDSIKGGTGYLGFVVFFLTLILMLSLPISGTASGSKTIKVPEDYQSIQKAINMSQNGDTIVVATGRYTEQVDFRGKKVTLRSQDPDNPNVVNQTILSGNKEGNVVEFRGQETNSAVLEGFTIKHGLETYGAGIIIRNASPTIRNNVITKNGAKIGGGIYVAGKKATPLIEGNSISGNIATERGGGIEVRYEASPRIINNKIDNNLAMEGAGLEISYGANPEVRDNVITGSWAGADMRFPFHAKKYFETSNFKETYEEFPNFGSGILIVNGCSPTIVDNLIGDSFGGGVAILLNSSPRLVGNRVVRNQGEQLGGGLLIGLDSSPELVENEIGNNRAIRGGGIYIINKSSPKIKNNHIYSNKARAEGGGVFVWARSGPKILNNEFKDNEAARGEAIWIDRTSSKLSSLKGNSSEGTKVLKSPLGELDQGKVIEVPQDHQSIQQAINVAENGDQIIVHPGTYYETINYHGKAITVKSKAGSKSTVIDGLGIGPVVTFESGEGKRSVLDGFTITHGRGGIDCRRSSPTIKNNIIKENQAKGGGGGINNYLSSPIIENNMIKSNKATTGAGLSLWFSSPKIIDNTIEGNEVTDKEGNGGGIFLDHFSLALIKNNKIYGNYAPGGGGISFDSSFSGPLVSGNIIQNNRAESGAGLYFFLDSSPLVKNNIISHNEAKRGASVLAHLFCSPKFIHNTIAYNIAEQGNSGIGSYAGSDVTLINSILWNEGVNINKDGGGEVSVNYSNTKYLKSGKGNISRDPHFQSEDDLHLSKDSPCIDAGKKTEVTVDIDGDKRPIGDGFDIGADESPVTKMATKERKKTQFPSLQEAIDRAEPGDVIEVVQASTSENLIIDKNITIKGIGDKRTLIRGEKEERSVIEVRGWSRDVKITLENLRIGFAPQENGFEVGGSAVLNLDDVVVMGNGSNGLEIGDQAEVRINNSDLLNNGISGIELYDNAKVVITNSTILNNQERAIWAHDSVSVTVDNTTISNNMGGGVYLFEKPEGKPKSTIKNSKITNNDGCGIYAESEDSIIACTNNTVENNSEGNFCEDGAQKCKQ